MADNIHIHKNIALTLDFCEKYEDLRKLIFSQNFTRIGDRVSLDLSFTPDEPIEACGTQSRPTISADHGNLCELAFEFNTIFRSLKIKNDPLYKALLSDFHHLCKILLNPYRYVIHQNNTPSDKRYVVYHHCIKQMIHILATIEICYFGRLTM